MDFEPEEADELEGFVHQTLLLPQEDDGELVATLVHRPRQAPGAHAGPTEKRRIVYIHGFVDYFFQTHVACAFEAAGFEFFALDLRRHGRSLRPGNRANFAVRVDDFFPEITAAIQHAAGDRPVTVVAHSTGGLVASIYAARGARRSQIEKLITVSAFFRFPTRGAEQLKLGFARRLGRLTPRLHVPQELSPIYGQTLHKSERGEWDYDLAKKPLRGFPFFAGWATMICDAQDEVDRGLNLPMPVLSLHSARSKRPGAELSPADFAADTVLNVADIAEQSKKLGAHVEVLAVPDGLHDLTLSKEPARHAAISAMIEFALRGRSP